jgi:hypothetical protein
MSKIELSTIEKVAISVLLESRIATVKGYLEQYGYDAYYIEEVAELIELNKKMGF